MKHEGENHIHEGSVPLAAQRLQDLSRYATMVASAITHNDAKPNIHTSIPTITNHIGGQVRKHLTILFFFLLISGNSYAQKQGQELIDSLKADISNTAKDTNLVKKLGRLSFEYYRFDVKQGINYGMQALHLADSLSWKKGVAYANNSLGNNYSTKGEYPKALECYMKSLSLYTEIGNRERIAAVCNNIGNFYNDQKNVTKAFEYLNKALAINENIRNQRGVSLNYNNLANIYRQQKLYVQANELYHKALEIDQIRNNKDAISRDLYNISASKVLTKEYCESLEYGFRALKISTEIRSNYNQGRSSKSIGEAYYGLASDSMISPNNCKHHKSTRKENLRFAIKYLNESLFFSTKLNNLSTISEVSFLLSKAYEDLGDSKNALLFFKKYSENKDSVFTRDNSVKIANIESKFEIESREKLLAIKNLEIKNKNAQMLFQVILSTIILIMVLTLSYALFKKQKIQKTFNLELKNKNKELENYLFVASHDLRSPMVNIQGFSQRLQKQSDEIKAIVAECPLEVETKARFEKITNDGISKTLNFIVSNITKMDILINGLLQVSRTGRIDMVIQKVNMNKLFNTIIAGNNFQISELSATVIVTDLPDCYGDENLLNQLFSNIIGNALKYRDKTRPLEIKIAGRTKNNKAIYSIKDTGIGIPPKYLEKIWDVFFRVDANSPEVGEGIGLNLVKRITDKHLGKIWVESTEGVGSTFYIELQKNVFSE
ncbi:MAG: hypothetical protein EHM93_20165 [Bacteroidales bacterium]|nr:MAG: hypothetical protein EHM93_20165 [Bacteroidales bacterium]